MKKKLIIILISLLILTSVSVFVVIMLKTGRAAGITASPNPANAHTSTDYCFGWNVGAGGYAAGDYLEYEFAPGFNLDDLEINCDAPGCITTNELSLFVGNQTCDPSGTERIAYPYGSTQPSPDMAYTDKIKEIDTSLFDNIHGYLYVVSSLTPAKIIKIKASDFSYVATLDLPLTDDQIFTGVMDASGGYAYFGASGSIIKIKLSNFTRVAALPLGGNFSSAIDNTNHFAYFGTSHGDVNKIDLSDFSLADTLNLDSDTLFSAVIDPAGGYLYFGSGSFNNKVFRVQLSNFSSAGSVDITDASSAPIDGLSSAVIDPDNHFAYFISYTNSPAQIARVNLTGFTYDHNTDLLTLNPGEESPNFNLGSIDTANGYAYFGLPASPGIVAKIKLSDFSEQPPITGAIGEDAFTTSVIDLTNHWLYYSLTSPARVVRFNLDSFTRDSALPLHIANKAYFILGTPVAADSDVSFKFTERNGNNSVLTPAAGSYSLNFYQGPTSDYSVSSGDSTTLNIVDTSAFGNIIVNVYQMDGVTHLNGATLTYNCDGAPVTATDGGAGDDDGTVNGVITRLSASVAADAATCNDTDNFSQFDISSDGYTLAASLPPAYSTGSENDVNQTMTGNYRFKVVKEDNTGNFTGLGSGDFTFGTLHSDFREVGAGVYEFAIPAAIAVSREVAKTGYATNTGTDTSVLFLQPAAQIDDTGTPLSMLYGLKVVTAQSNGAAVSGLNINTFRGAGPSATNTNNLYWADTIGAAGALILQKTGYTNSETTNPAFSAITTGTANQVAITLGAFPACAVAPLAVSSNCEGLISTAVIPSGGGVTQLIIEPQPQSQSQNLITSDPTPAEPLPAGIIRGKAVKISGVSTVYFIDQDNRRHAFPNELVFFSIFPNFNQVITIPAATLAQIPIGSNVTVLAGTYLLKIVGDPKVYAVEPYGVLRWVSSEEIAKKLYGLNWAQRVIDINPVFLDNYQLGSEISTPGHPTGSLIQYVGSVDIYRIEKGSKRLVKPEVFKFNGFQDVFVIKNVSPDLSYPTGSDLVNTPIETLVTLR